MASTDEPLLVGAPKRTPFPEGEAAVVLMQRGLTRDDAVRIASRLPRLRTLTELDLSHNAIGADGVHAIAGALPSAPSIASLSLSATGSADSGARALADALRAGCGLTSLKLVGCWVKDAGGLALADALDAGAPLVSLGLGWNSIRGEAARALARAAVAATQLELFCSIPLGTLRAGQLPPPPPLTERDRRRRPEVDPTRELHLQGHGCGAPGAHAVSALLPRLPRLDAIVMPYQDLKDEGAEAVARGAAEAGCDLKFLMLSRNDVGDGVAARIRQLFPSLDEFTLRINNHGG